MSEVETGRQTMPKMIRFGLFTLAVPILAHLTAALAPPSCLTQTLARQARVKPLAFFPSHEVEDSYDDLLDLERSIDPAEAINASVLNNLYENFRHNALSDEGTSATSESTLERLLAKQFGDLNTVPADEEPWMAEVRDIIEKKRGMAIWSKRSDHDIQKEAKKAITSRGMHIPVGVATVVNAVFVEKICTLSEMKAEEGVAYGEYRRWLREQREKLKKDPLPAVKLELVKRWLERHPAARAATAITMAKRVGGGGLGLLLRARPTVVLDEVSDILDTRVSWSLPAPTEAGHDSAAFGAGDEDEEMVEYDAFGGMSAAVRDTGMSGSHQGRDIQSARDPQPPGVLATVPSILNWNKSQRELLAAEQHTIKSSGGGGGDAQLEAIRRGLLRRIASQRQRPTRDGEEAVEHSTKREKETPRGDGAQEALHEQDEYFVVL